MAGEPLAGPTRLGEETMTKLPRIAPVLAPGIWNYCPKSGDIVLLFLILFKLVEDPFDLFIQLFAGLQVNHHVN